MRDFFVRVSRRGTCRKNGTFENDKLLKLNTQPPLARHDGGRGYIYIIYIEINMSLDYSGKMINSRVACDILPTIEPRPLLRLSLFACKRFVFIFLVFFLHPNIPKQPPCNSDAQRGFSRFKTTIVCPPRWSTAPHQLPRLRYGLDGSISALFFSFIIYSYVYIYFFLKRNEFIIMYYDTYYYDKPRNWISIRKLQLAAPRA